MKAKRPKKKRAKAPPRKPAPSPAALPVGTIQAYAGEEVPKGWLICDGRAVERGKYQKLFKVIGPQYGPGDRSTTFNVPDLRGRFPLGGDRMGGTAAGRVMSPDALFLGGSGGRDKHQLALEEIPSHQHLTETVRGEPRAIPAGGGGGAAAGRQRTMVHIREAGESLAASTSAAGGNLEHENMSPFLTVNYIIFAGEP